MAATMSWRIHRHRGAGIAGFADTTSVAPGSVVTLYVSTRAASFDVRVFRMGWYDGRLGQLVRTVRHVRGIWQPPAVIEQPRQTAVARWRPTVQLDTQDLVPGDYLLRLDGSDGSMSYVPLTVRGPTAAGAVVLVSPVTTWQAYNLWGCCDLYNGADGSFATRARAVSFDRPYLAEDGAGEFLNRELPVLAEAERLRLPLDYLTSLDLDGDPHLLDGARAVITMGHDEYWSPAMRTAVVAARNAGTNIAFLGANAVYRRIRMEPSPLGPQRVEVDYKIAAEDPMLGVRHAVVTSDWGDQPDAHPASEVTGESYGCFTRTQVPAVVVGSSSPLFEGTGAITGTKLPGAIGPETDRVLPGDKVPGTVQVLMHSPFPCPLGYASYADTTYTTFSSGAAVFDAGTESWVCAMSGHCAPPATAAVLTQITDNLLLLFARSRA